jgi:hypothetical protein
MSKIMDVKKTVVEFIKENITCYDVTVVKIEKINDIWNTIAEVYEDDSFLKAMNMPPKQIRLFYSVKMDENLEVTYFERLNSFEGSDGSDN